MALTWKPKEWKSASADPVLFLNELRSIKNPSARLEHKTYSECIKTAYKLLPNNYHEEFFSLLINRLPHPESVKPKTEFELNTNSYIESDYAVVTSRSWVLAVSKVWDINKKERAYDWMFTFCYPDDKYPPIDWPSVSFDKGPSWLRSFVFSRTKDYKQEYKIKWLKKLDSLSLPEALDIVVATAHHEAFKARDLPTELSTWTISSLEHCLKRMQHADLGISDDQQSQNLEPRLVFDIVKLAISNKNNEYDEYISNLMAGPMKTVNAMLCFFISTDGSYNKNRVTLSEWFLRQSDSIKDKILINLCANKYFTYRLIELGVRSKFAEFLNLVRIVFPLQAQKEFLNYYSLHLKNINDDSFFNQIFPLWNTAHAISDKPLIWLREALDQNQPSDNKIELPDMDLNKS